jgi:hypothetical protein
MHKMRPREFAESDNGYRGQTNCVRAADIYATSEERKIKGVALNRHETCNKRLKQFGCLKQRCRHHLSDHRLVFGSVAVLTQLEIENGAPLFKVEWSVHTV